MSPLLLMKDEESFRADRLESAHLAGETMCLHVTREQFKAIQRQVIALLRPGSGSPIVLKHCAPAAARETVEVDALRGEVQALGRKVETLSEEPVGANGVAARRF